MLMPKRVKRRRVFRGRMKGKAQRGNFIAYGEYGIMALEPAWVTSNQIEAARIAMTRYVKRQGQVWTKIFPDKPVTAKPAETRMGSGKGSPEYWVAVLIGSVIIRYTGWYFIDPLLSVGIGVFILTNVCRNLYTIFRILLQAAPEHMPEDKIKAILQEVPNVKDVHDLHVWTLDGERNIASAHLIVADDISRADAIRVKHDAVDRLKGVGIDHLTVEVEFEGEGCYSCPVE